jgi:hypothetical protein
MDSKIIRFSYEALRNEAHVEYHSNVNAFFGTYTPDALGIVPQYATYKTAYDDEVSALDIVLKSDLTAKIEKQDGVRDSIFRGFVDAVKSDTRHFDPAKRESANKIDGLLKHYGNIAARSIDQETAAIDDLIRELQTGANAPSVQVLGLDDWLTQLQVENDTLKTLMQQRYAETADRPAVRMKTTRKATDAAFRAILNQIDALALVNGAANYTAFINALNAVSERFKNILAQEAGTRKSNRQ